MERTDENNCYNEGERS